MRIVAQVDRIALTYDKKTAIKVAQEFGHDDKAHF